MQKTKIEWCTSTWNPVTGCLNKCPYCYARKIAQRFGGHGDCRRKYPSLWPKNQNYIQEIPAKIIRKNRKESVAPFPFFFAPTFHKYRLSEPEKHKKPERIFVCSMADLFGPWIPDGWITQVFDACKKAPQHKYMFLTKFPDRYKDLFQKDMLPEEDNFFYGTTATTRGKVDRAFDQWVWPFPHDHLHTFLSIEPILEDLGEGYDIETLAGHDLIILGAETGNRKNKVIPKNIWVYPFIKECDSVMTPVFMKDSMIPIVGENHMLRQLPKGLLLPMEAK